jgi:hypothetical protein
MVRFAAMSQLISGCFSTLSESINSMFSRIASVGKSSFLKQASKVSYSVNQLSRFTAQSSRGYSTGSASCRSFCNIVDTLATSFQIGFALAAGLGCGAALLYGNRLFAVEVIFLLVGKFIG